MCPTRHRQSHQHLVFGSGLSYPSLSHVTDGYATTERDDFLQAQALMLSTPSTHETHARHAHRPRHRVVRNFPLILCQANDVVMLQLVARRSILGNVSLKTSKYLGSFHRLHAHFLTFQVASRHPSRAHLLHVRVVHSKLASGRWPRLETDAHLPRRVKATLASWGFESNRRKAIGAGLDGEGTVLEGW